MKHVLQIAVIAASLAGPAVSGGFYEGKTINYIIATSPGGGYDAYGRLIGQHLAEVLEADKVIFQNLPGAGHIIGANTLFASEPDGLTIGTFNTGLIYAQLLQQEGIRFDLRQFSWIGKAASDARAIVLSENSGFSSIEDLVANTDRVLFAASGIGSANYTETKLIASALGLNIEMVAGYNGNEGEMAMMRGEVVGQVASTASLHGFIDAGNGFYAAYIGGGRKPQAIDYAIDDNGRSIISLIDANSNLGRLTAAPPGVPQEVIEELRDAYMKVLTDPAVLAEAEKMGLPIDPARGDVVANMVGAALQQSPESIEIISGALDVDIPTITATSEILSLEDRNKLVGFMSGDAMVIGSVSGSRTALTVNGETADRSALAVGMTCDFVYDPASDGNEFNSVDCTGGASPQEEAGVTSVNAAIDSLEDDNKVVGFTVNGTAMTGSVSGKRTAVTIAGAASDRDGLAVGMTCDMEYDSTAAEIEFISLTCN